MPLTIEDVIGKIENDRLYKKGLELGLEQGLEQGYTAASEKFIAILLRDGKYTPAEISNITGVSPEIVMDKKRQIEQEKSKTQQKQAVSNKPTKKNKG